MKETNEINKNIAVVLATAFGTPPKTMGNLPVNDPNFFCPGVLQREFYSCAQGKFLGNKEITHLATQHVSSCLVLVLHNSVSPPQTGIAHLDEKTNVPETLNNALQPFSSAPTATILSRDFFPDNFELLKSWPGGETKARSAIAEMKQSRLERTEQLVSHLLERGVHIKSIDLECRYPTFIVDIKTGAAINSISYDDYISHNRDVDAYLQWFFGTHKDRHSSVAINPYANFDAA